MEKNSKYIEEEVDIAPYVRSGVIDIRNEAARDNINTFLNGATGKCFITPYNAFERVAKVLANFHIYLNRPPFMEGDRGIQVLDVDQFGKLAGMRNTGEVVTRTDTDYHLYFEYKMNEKGLYDIFAEILTTDEVEAVLADAEEDLNDEDVEDDREDKFEDKKLYEGTDYSYGTKGVDKPSRKKLKFSLRPVVVQKPKKPQYQKDVEDAIDKEDRVDEGWSEKYKRSIDCDRPKGFSQKAHCAGKKKLKEETEMATGVPADYYKIGSKTPSGVKASGPDPFANKSAFSQYDSASPTTKPVMKYDPNVKMLNPKSVETKPVYKGELSGKSSKELIRLAEARETAARILKKKSLEESKLSKADLEAVRLAQIMAANMDPKRRKKVPGIKLKSTKLGSKEDLEALKAASASLATMDYKDKKRRKDKLTRQALAKKYPELANLYMKEQETHSALEVMPRGYRTRYTGTPEQQHMYQVVRQRMLKKQTASDYNPKKLVPGHATETPKPKG